MSSRHDIWYGQRELLLIRAMRNGRLLRELLLEDPDRHPIEEAVIVDRLMSWSRIEDRLHCLLNSSSEVL
jgi:hypothetical protein